MGVTSEVHATGVLVERDDDGWYTVKHWSRLKGSTHTEHVSYLSLSWGEALDCVFSCLVASRPGWVIGAGWSQPPLFDPEP